MTFGVKHEASWCASSVDDGELYRVIVPLENADVWSYAGLRDHFRGPMLLWHESEGKRFVALGVTALGPDFHGPDPQAARLWCSRIREQTISASPTSLDAPLIVGGMGFPGLRTQRKPGAPWAGWGGGRLWVPEALIVHSEGRCQAVVTAQRDALDALVTRVTCLLDQVRPIDPAPPACGQRTCTDSAARDVWRRRVRVLVDAMRSPGAPFEKVVLARSQAVEASAGRVFDPISTAWHLRAQQPGCTAFAWIADDGCAFVGATPELLCRFDGQRLETTALAGTAPRGRTPHEDTALARALIAEAKERSEHRLVVDAIHDALREMGAEVSLSDTPRVRRLGDVQHLETPMSATLPQGCDLLGVVDRLHPTPAVGGAPREAALAWLAAHEDLDRGLYAAPIGWLDVRGRGSFHVALRSAFVTPRRAWAYAGAGIVAGSEPDAEWREVNHKLTALGRALTTRLEVTP